MSALTPFQSICEANNPDVWANIARTTTGLGLKQVYTKMHHRSKAGWFLLNGKWVQRSTAETYK